MKKNIITIMVLCLVLVGCSKDSKVDTYGIKKEALSISSIKGILDSYEKNGFSKRAILLSVDVSENTSNLENIYRIGFPFTIINSDIQSRLLDVSRINVDLCRNEMKQTSIDKNSQIQEFFFNSDNKATVFLSLERLKNKNIVSQTLLEQEDICLYMNESISYNNNDEAIKKSNVITFTADEINTIRVEYESLTQ